MPKTPYQIEDCEVILVLHNFMTPKIRHIQESIKKRFEGQLTQKLPQLSIVVTILPSRSNTGRPFLSKAGLITVTPYLIAPDKIRKKMQDRKYLILLLLVQKVLRFRSTFFVYKLFSLYLKESY
jgi:hypothetical protein